MSETQDKKNNPKRRLFLSFLAITAFFVAVLVLILPYHLYQKDSRDARKKAKEFSELIRIGLLSTMKSTGNSIKIRGLIDEYKTVREFKIRLIRSSFVERQHGIIEDEQATDDLIKSVLSQGKSRDGWLDATTYRFVSPFISDKTCQECHEGLDGAKIGIGNILGASEVIFDLKSKRDESIRLIIEVTMLMIAALITIGIVFYFIVKKGILDVLEQEETK